MSSLFSPSELSYTSHPLLTPSLTRSDARSPTSFRPISLSTSISNNTLGSSKVSVSSALGGGVTEVWAGVRGEVENCVEGGGGRVVVAVECAPTALSSIRPDLLPHLSSLLTSLFTPTSPTPFLLSLQILPRKSWTLYLDILILSSAGGNIPDLSLIAARAALATTRLPKTLAVGYEEGGDKEGVGMAGGFSGLVKGGKAGKDTVDFELVDEGDGGVRVKGWEDLPVGITFNLINQLPHLDATILEEAASSSQVIFCFNGTGDLASIQQIGEGEIEMARFMPLLADARTFSSELIASLNKQLKDA